MISWEYPIYLIPHGGGYASIVDPRPASEDQLLVIHTTQAASAEFMQRFSMLGTPRALQNDREFRWLLLSLRDPVRQVAFDPNPVEHDLNASWIAAVGLLLDEVLEPDFSPWNYPIFVVAQGEGFASIQGESGDNQELTALVVFTSRDRAEHYLKDGEIAGALCEVAGVEEARRFFLAIQEVVSAVALDPVVGEETLSALRCFTIDTLLEKYLVQPGKDSSHE